MGRNGMGKTTTVRSIMGLTPARAGAIRFDGEDIRGLPPYRIAQRGIGLVPEGRQIFPNLTVRENLLATAVARDGGAWTLDAVYDLFPRLAERDASMGNQLSGGEQQMLAIGRALMTNPRLLILDEATEGLAPLIRAEIWRCLARLKASGLAILVIDKNVGTLHPRRRPPFPHRARARGVERVLGRARRRARGAAPVFGGLVAVRANHTGCHRPRKRAIQYAAAPLRLILRSIAKRCVSTDGAAHGSRRADAALITMRPR